MPRPEAIGQAALPTASALDSALDSDRLVTLARDTVRIKSYSGDEAEIADYMASAMSDLGLDVTLQPVAPRRFNAIGVWRGSGGAPSFMYNGHMDTNPAGEGWTRDPLAGDVDEAFVYGIGISNMKSSNAAFLHSLEMLKATGFEPAGDLVAAYVVGELQGGVGTVKMIENGTRADYFIVGEPTELTLLTRHAASFVFEIWIYGKTRHLSRREEGIDALAKMEAFLPKLRALEFSGAETDADRELNRIHIGVIRAGVSDQFLDWRPQQLADTCVIKCAGRFGPSQNLDSAMADIQALLNQATAEDSDLRAELKLVEDNRIFMPPFSVGDEAIPVQSVIAAHRAVAGATPKVGTHTPAKFFGSDAAHLAAAGMTGLLYGSGGKYNTMPDERVAIDEMLTASRVYSRTVVDLIGRT